MRSYQTKQDWALFAILLLVELFVFVKLKLRIDLLGTLTLITQLIVIIGRLLSSYFDTRSFLWLAFLTYSLNMLLAATYIFILEIVKIQLAKQPGTSQAKFRNLKYFKWFSLLQMFVYCFAMTWAQYLP